MTFKRLTLGFLAFSSIILVGTTNAASHLPVRHAVSDSLVTVAQVLINNREYDSALAILPQAITSADKNRDFLSEVQAVGHSYDIYILQHDTAAADVLKRKYLDALHEAQEMNIRDQIIRFSIINLVFSEVEWGMKDGTNNTYPNEVNATIKLIVGTPYEALLPYLYLKLSGVYMSHGDRILVPDSRISLYLDKAMASAKLFEDSAFIGKILTLEGLFLFADGYFEQARDTLQKALEYLLPLKNKYNTLTSLQQLWVTQRRLGDDSGVVTTLTTAIPIAKQYGSRSVLAFALADYCFLLIKTAQYEEALDHLFEELTHREHLGDASSYIRCLGDIHSCYVHLGKKEEAAKYAWLAFSLAQSLDETARVGNMAGDIIVLFDEIGKTDLSDSVAQYLIDEISHLELLALSANVYDSLSRTSYYDALEAMSIYYESVARPHNLDSAEYYAKLGYYFSRGRNQDWEAKQLLRLGTIAYQKSDRSEAIYLVKEALTTAITRQSSDIALMHYALSGYLSLDGKQAEALAHADSALAYYASVVDTTKALGVLRAMVTQLLTSRDTLAGIERATQLVELSRQIGDYKNTVFGLGILSHFSTIQGDSIQSRKSAIEALKIAEEYLEGDEFLSSSINLLLILMKYPQYAGTAIPSVINKFERTLANDGSSIDYQTIATWYWQVHQDSKSASKYYKQAISKWDGSIASDPFATYASFLLATNDGLKAIPHFRKSLSLTIAMGSDSLSAERSFDIGVIYLNQQEFRMAVRFFRESRHHLDQLTEKQSSYFVDGEKLLLLYLSLCHRSLGEYEHAIEVAHEAAQDDSYLKHFAYWLLSSTFDLRGRSDSARHFGQLAYDRSPTPNDKFISAFVLLDLAYGRGDSTEVTYYSDILRSVKYVVDTSDVVSIVTNLTYGATWLCMSGNEMSSSAFNLAFGLARKKGDFTGLRKSYYASSLCNMLSGNIDQALIELDSVYSIMGIQLSRTSDPSVASHLTRIASNTFVRYVDACMVGYSRDSESSMLARIIDKSEIVTARSFAIEIQHSKVIQEKTTFVREYTNRLKDDVSQMQSRIAIETNDSGTANLIRSRDSLFRELRFLSTYSPNSMIAMSDNLSIDPVTLKQFREQVLDTFTIVVRYFLGSNHSWAIAFDKARTWAYELPPSEELSVGVKSIRAYYLNYSAENSLNEIRTLKVESGKLFSVLLGPLASVLTGKRLIIIPDGVLYLLPFELLVIEGEDSLGGLEPSAVNYLLSSTTVSYSPSLTVYSQLHAEASEDVSPGALLVGKSVFNDIQSQEDSLFPISRSSEEFFSSIPNLKYVDEEIYAIQRVLEDAELSSNDSHEVVHTTVLLGDNASETQLTTSLSKQYKYIHFATHSIIDEGHPQYSALLLSRSPQSQGAEDGLLYSFEISELSMPAELVTLSACNTGRGALTPGEGVIGLNLAFFRAGARSLCLSLWTVDDQATATFMEQFYKYLNGGMTKIESLRYTKQFMLTETEYKSPYFWAPFVLYGNPM